MKRKPPKTSSRKLEIDLNGEGLDGFIGYAQGTEGKEFGLSPAADGSGATVGIPLGYGQYEGKALTELPADRGVFQEINLAFTVRISYDNQGTTYLELIFSGHQTYWSFPFKGVEFRDALFATAEFESRLARFLAQYGIYSLFWALYRQTDEAQRKESYEKIRSNLEHFFRNILVPKREKEIGVEEAPGVRVTSYARVETGRNPKSTTELDREKKQFQNDVYKALTIVEAEGGKRTQLDVGLVVFATVESGDVQSRMKHALKRYGLKWKELLKEFDLSRKAKI